MTFWQWIYTCNALKSPPAAVTFSLVFLQEEEGEGVTMCRGYPQNLMF